MQISDSVDGREERNADFFAIDPAPVEQPVIESFSVTDPVPCQVKSDPRDNDQIGFVSLMINPGRTRLQNPERPLLQLFNPFDAAKHHLMAADSRIENPLPGEKCSGQNQSRVGFIMGRSIQRYTLSPGILI